MSLSNHIVLLVAVLVSCTVVFWRLVVESRKVKLNINIDPDLARAYGLARLHTRHQLLRMRAAKGQFSSPNNRRIWISTVPPTSTERPSLATTDRSESPFNTFIRNSSVSMYIPEKVTV